MKWTGLILAFVLLTTIGCRQQTEQAEGPASAGGEEPATPVVETGHAYVELTDANFQTVVLDSDKPVLVDFFADWCPPCRQMSPVVNELASDMAGKAVVGKLNVDNAQDLAINYGVETIPTFVVFKRGQEVGRDGGIMTKQELADLLTPYL